MKFRSIRDTSTRRKHWRLTIRWIIRSFGQVLEVLFLPNNSFHDNCYCSGCTERRNEVHNSNGSSVFTSSRPRWPLWCFWCRWLSYSDDSSHIPFSFGLSSRVSVDFRARCIVYVVLLVLNPFHVVLSSKSYEENVVGLQQMMDETFGSLITRNASWATFSVL